MKLTIPSKESLKKYDYSIFNHPLAPKDMLMSIQYFKPNSKKHHYEFFDDYNSVKERQKELGKEGFITVGPTINTNLLRNTNAPK